MLGATLGSEIGFTTDHLNKDAKKGVTAVCNLR